MHYNYTTTKVVIKIADLSYEEIVEKLLHGKPLLVDVLKVTPTGGTYVLSYVSKKSVDALQLKGRKVLVAIYPIETIAEKE